MLRYGIWYASPRCAVVRYGMVCYGVLAVWYSMLRFGVLFLVEKQNISENEPHKLSSMAVTETYRHLVYWLLVAE